MLGLADLVLLLLAAAAAWAMLMVGVDRRAAAASAVPAPSPARRRSAPRVIRGRDLCGLGGAVCSSIALSLCGCTFGDHLYGMGRACMRARCCRRTRWPALACARVVRIWMLCHPSTLPFIACDLLARAGSFRLAGQHRGWSDVARRIVSHSTSP